MSRITFFINDNEDNPAGVISIKREDVMEVTYNMVENKLMLMLSSVVGYGGTEVRPVQNQSVRSEKIPGTNRTRPVLDPKPSYTFYPLYENELSNNKFTIVKEDDIRRAWNWLHANEPAENVISFDEMLKIRNEMLEKVRQERERLEAGAKEKAEKEAAENTPKILNQHGAPVSDLDKQ